MAGEVEIEGRGTNLKAGTRLKPEDKVIVKERPRFVSRGGEKLDGVLGRWGLDVTGKLALDVGASTGGFTQCLLQRGASRVISLDVGKGQLHWDLRRDPRVEVMEKRNVRHLEAADLPCRPQLATIDVSFISLRLVLPVLADILDEGMDLVALIKPQFEAGRGKVGKGGVVRDPDIHLDVLGEVLEAAAGEGFELRELAPSPLKGADGNIEFFAWWVKGEEGGGKKIGEEAEKVVREAWDER